MAKNQKDSALCFRENYLKNHLVKFMQDGSNPKNSSS